MSLSSQCMYYTLGPSIPDLHQQKPCEPFDHHHDHVPYVARCGMIDSNATRFLRTTDGWRDNIRLCFYESSPSQPLAITLPGEGGGGGSGRFSVLPRPIKQMSYIEHVFSFLRRGHSRSVTTPTTPNRSFPSNRNLEKRKRKETISPNIIATCP